MSKLTRRDLLGGATNAVIAIEGGKLAGFNRHGLVLAAAQVSGLNSAGTKVTFYGYNGQPKNIFIIGGTGHVPALA